MRLLELLVPDERRAETLSVLEDYDVDYAVIEEAGDRAESTLLHFPLPTEAVDELLEAIREEADVGPESYTVVYKAETATTKHIDELEGEYGRTTAASEDTLLAEELLTEARDFNPHRNTFVATTLLSAVVATAGLLRNSAAAVVGAMVIAPFFGAALSAITGITCGDRTVLVQGVRSQILGLLLAIGGATAVAYLLRAAALVPPQSALTRSTQFSLFVSPSVTAVSVAVAAGAAGVFALATSVPVALAGVAIAAAFVPTAAAVGISLAWGDAGAATGALVLLAANLCAVNLTGVAVLAGLGYRPNADLRRLISPDGSTVVRVAVVLVVVLFVAGTAAATAEQIAFTRSVNRTADAYLNGRPADLTLASVSSEFVLNPFTHDPTEVTVTVVRSDGRPHPGLESALARRLTRATGREVAVRVRYVDVAGTRGATA
ncbi:MAG: TIGR00341 family protein [Salinigranum sp.]